ncbi:hypothetical protein Hanom_Chr04g00374841 [Helianthus anomalus]
MTSTCHFSTDDYINFVANTERSKRTLKFNSLDSISRKLVWSKLCAFLLAVFSLFDVFSEHSRRNCHGHKLLEQQFTCVRNMHLNNISLVLASSTLERVLFKISNRDQPTTLANMNPVRITLVKQSFLKKMSSTMSNHAVPFHFTKPKPTIT